MRDIRCINFEHEKNPLPNSEMLNEIFYGVATFAHNNSNIIFKAELKTRDANIQGDYNKEKFLEFIDLDIDSEGMFPPENIGKIFEENLLEIKCFIALERFLAYSKDNELVQELKCCSLATDYRFWNRLDEEIWAYINDDFFLKLKGYHLILLKR